MDSQDQFDIAWHDHGREPQCAPDPDYPNGKIVDGARGSPLVCTANLPYPARRCGYYTVRCTKCGLSVVITTAGRPDDPRSVRLGCIPSKQDIH